jgi:hypothetical protein
VAEPACALCVYLQAQVERLQNDNLALRLQVANGLASVSCRQDLERVNATLAERNRRIEQLESQLRKKAG